MADISKEVGALADADMWMDVLFLFVGFVVPTLLANTVDDRIADLPNEVYGLVIVVGANVLMDSRTSTTRMLSLGGGLYTLDAVLDRFGIKQELDQMGA